MGFSIYIREYELIHEDGRFEEGDLKEETGISYNWSDLREVCFEHLLVTGRCSPSCKLEHLWYFKDDCHCRQGRWIALRIEKTLETLRKFNIRLVEAPKENDNWFYGMREQGEEKLPPFQRYQSFYYILTHLQRLAYEYPDCFFIGDHEKVTKLHLLDGDTYFKTSKEYYEHYSESGEVVDGDFYNHPYKGNFRVDTFKGAIEVFGLLSLYNDPGANFWYDYAMMITEDSPLKMIK